MKQLAEVFSRLAARIRGLEYVDEGALKEIIRELQRALLRADVPIELVQQVSRSIEERVKAGRVPPGVPLKEYVMYVLYEELTRLLGGEKPHPPTIRKRPYVIMLVGVEGSGKTTTAAKMANFFKRKGLRVGLVQTDTYRPAAFDQLKQLAAKIGVHFFDERPRDPVEAARRGVETLSRQADLVIVDTAGRHRNELELLEEAKAIYESVRPDEVVLVVDATVGRQAALQAETFKRYVPVSSVIITKMDSSARGGGALAAVANTNAVVKFIGIGEDIDELELFDPRRFVSRLLGMGDIGALVERIREVIEETNIEEEIGHGKLTLRTFMKQLEAFSRLGPLNKLAALLPSQLVGKISEEQLEMSAEKLKKWKAILRSMTREEIENPHILNASRIRRIAMGSGTSVRDVKELLQAYEQARKLLKTFRRQGRRIKGLERIGGP